MEIGWQTIDGALYFLDPATGNLTVDTVLDLEGVLYQAVGFGFCTPLQE